MKKLRMTVDDLEVASFDTEAKPAESGTVAELSGFTCPACPSVPTRYGTCCTP